MLDCTKDGGAGNHWRRLGHLCRREAEHRKRANAGMLRGPRPRQAMRVEHEYERRGALCYRAWDVRHAKLRSLRANIRHRPLQPVGPQGSSEPRSRLRRAVAAAVAEHPAHSCKLAEPDRDLPRALTRPWRCPSYPGRRVGPGRADPERFPSTYDSGGSSALQVPGSVSTDGSAIRVADHPCRLGTFARHRLNAGDTLQLSAMTIRHRTSGHSTKRGPRRAGQPVRVCESGVIREQSEAKGNYRTGGPERPLDRLGAVISGLFMIIAVPAFNFVGDGLRDAAAGVASALSLTSATCSVLPANPTPRALTRPWRCRRTQGGESVQGVPRRHVEAMADDLGAVGWRPIRASTIVSRL